MLLPSSRKSSGSNFFLFLLTVCNVGWLLLFLLFIIRVIIFPDISFNKEIPQVHPYCCHQFKFHQMRAIRVYTTTRLDQGWHADLTNQILTYINMYIYIYTTSPGWLKPFGPFGANRYPVTSLKWYERHYQHGLTTQWHTHGWTVQNYSMDRTRC